MADSPDFADYPATAFPGSGTSLALCANCGIMTDVGEHRPGCPYRVEPKKEFTPAADTCLQVSGLVSGDRQRTHGDKLENHQNIAALWGAFLGVKLTATQAALMMALLKIARTKIGAHNPDDYVDLICYGACAAEIAERESNL